MKIVVLDGHTLNPGDLSWSALEELGTLTVYDRTSEEQVVSRAKDAEALLVNKTILTEELFDKLPNVKYVGILATGYNTVDVAAAGRRGITVTNVPAYGTPSVAQLTFALLLELCSHVQAHSNAVHSGEWSASADFCFWKYPLTELAKKTMGIIGFGQIGRNVAKIAYAFDLNVIGYDVNKDKSYSHPGFKWGSLDDIFKESDIVSLHCPLFPENKEMINKSALDKMKETAFFLNTARGGLVAEQDLANALNCGSIAGAGIDVLTKEPPSEDNPLIKAKNCIITPHIAWASLASRSRMMDSAADNLKHFLNNSPINTVSRFLYC